MSFQTQYSKREPTKGTAFGNPKIVKKGEEIDMRTWIQTNAEDTDIYETMAKYGTLPKPSIDHEKLYADFTQFQGLRGALEKDKEAKRMWENLPIDVRAEFEHNIYNFQENGQKWIEEKIKKHAPPMNPQPEQQIETKGETQQ